MLHKSNVKTQLTRYTRLKVH